jgi:hypothetical protein
LVEEDKMQKGMSGRIIEALSEASGMQMYASEPPGGMAEGGAGAFDVNQFEGEFDAFLNERFNMADRKTLDALYSYLESYVRRERLSLLDVEDGSEPSGGMGSEPSGGMGSGGMGSGGM